MKESPVAEVGEEESGETSGSPEKLAGANQEEETVPSHLLWFPACPEIVEEPEITIPAAAAAADRDESNDVYVAVGTKESSLDVLRWALREAVVPGSCVYLVHVYSPVTFIPTPLGMMSRDLMAPEIVEDFINEEQIKRSTLMQKYLKLCHGSQVQVDTVIVESDMVANAIVDVIDFCIVRKLVMGTTKWQARKGAGGKAGYVQRHAPPYCKVKIICDGKEAHF
ncbi:U-box domain-containing protein 33-like [Nymphaea colorata]|nr:U-box domain-containing protein 33-like [Nymphaea colorata]